MGILIGTSDLQKNVKRGSASGYVAIKGVNVQALGGKPKMTPTDKEATGFAIITDSRGEKRARRVTAADKSAAEKAAMATAMKNAGATVYLAQKVGSAEGRDVFKLVGSYRRA